jgi:hypothetical protein
VPAPMPDRPDTGFDEAEARALIDRANRGDASALPDVRRLLDLRADLRKHLGDLANHARMSLIVLAVGDGLAAREAILREVADLRARLLAESRGELEALLAERVVVCWLAVYQAELALGSRLQGGVGGDLATRAAATRLDRAHARCLTAIKTLATVQKLMRPGPTALDLARGAVQERSTNHVPESVRSRGSSVLMAN